MKTAGQLNLSRLLWLGGPANAGKTTIAKRLAERYEFQHYSFDEQAENHFQQLMQLNQTYHASFNQVVASRHLNISIPQTVAQALPSYRERFPLVLEDLKSFSPTVPILAEGIGFTPALIQPLLSDVNQAVWLIPTKRFLEMLYWQKSRFLQLQMQADGSAILDSLLKVDLHLADVFKAEVKTRRLQMVEVNGLQARDEIETAVMRHFNQFLATTMTM